MLVLEMFGVFFELCTTWFENPKQAFDESASLSIPSCPTKTARLRTCYVSVDENIKKNPTLNHQKKQ